MNFPIPWSLCTIKSPGDRSSSDIRSSDTFDFFIGLNAGLSPKISFSVRIRNPDIKNPDDRSPTVIDIFPSYSAIFSFATRGAITSLFIKISLSLSACPFDAATITTLLSFVNALTASGSS